MGVKVKKLKRQIRRLKKKLRSLRRHYSNHSHEDMDDDPPHFGFAQATWCRACGGKK